MVATTATSWIGVVSSFSALIIGLVTALWAYTKFIVERGLLPPAQFDVDCTTVANYRDLNLLEIVLHLTNLGGSTLITRNIRVDIRYLNRDDVPTLVPEGRLRGRVSFTGSVRRDLDQAMSDPPNAERPTREAGNQPDRVHDERERQTPTVDSPGPKPSPRSERRGFSVVPHATFVQPGVDQKYGFTTGVPSSAAHVLIWASFEYAQSPKPIQRAMIWLSRRLGLVQFTLGHVHEPHTIERVFNV